MSWENGKGALGSEVTRWERWENSEVVARLERWDGSEVVASWERWEGSQVTRKERGESSEVKK